MKRFDDHGFGRCAQRRRGFTLAEMLVSLVVMGILMVGISSAVLVALRSLDNGGTEAAAVRDASAAVNDILNELTYALYICEYTNTAITFTVPDRDGDGVPERIRYSWSGTAGDPLLREYNDGASETFVESVETLSFSYQTKSTTESYPGPPEEGAEELLSQFTTPTDSHDFKIESDKWCSQFLSPSLSSDAISWRATRAEVALKKEGSAVELTYVQLRSSKTDNTPSTTILAQASVAESTLSDSYNWTTVTLAPAETFLPGDGVCLVLQHSGTGGPSGKAQYDDDVGLYFSKTDNAGSSWSLQDHKTLLHKLYGHVTRVGADESSTFTYFTGVTLTLQTGEAEGTAVTDSAHLLNTPSKLDGLYHAEFDVDPTQDFNGDGEPDWTSAPGSFNGSSLHSGVWDVDGGLYTNPPTAFEGPVEIRLRWRATSLGTIGGLFLIDFDWESGTTASITAYLSLQANGTQTLKIDRATSVTSETVLELTGLPSDFVDLRILTNAQENTFNVTVNGANYGTLAYSHVDGTARLQGAVLTRGDAYVEVDDCYIAVGLMP